jgi:hypothetical protein
MSTRPDKQATVPSLVTLILISGLSMLSVLLLGNGISPLQFEPRTERIKIAYLHSQSICQRVIAFGRQRVVDSAAASLRCAKK